MTNAHALLVFVLLPLIGCGSPPDDEVLIERFTKDRPSFERLVELVAEEQSHVKLVPSGAYSFDENDSTKTMHPIMKPDPNQEPDPRDVKIRAEQTEIIRKLHISRMIADEYGVTFLATGMASDLSGYSKGWEFITEDDHQPDSTRVVGSLDGIGHDLKPYETRYRSLGDGWYLFLESTSD